MPSANDGPRTIAVKVKPKARSSTLVYDEEQQIWLAQLKAPPVDGKANAELISLVAKHFGCAKSKIRIKSGANGRHKWVQID